MNKENNHYKACNKYIRIKMICELSNLKKGYKRINKKT